MPEFRSREFAITMDMAGCPNRCRHCWLGKAPNRVVLPNTLREVARQFRNWIRPGESRPFAERLIVQTWYREPDYADNYRQLWELEKELSSQGAAMRFELLSIWRLARDEGYAAWAREIGTTACQISFFGLERTTDYFTRRAGSFRDCLVATERLLAAGIRPRWQLFLTQRIVPELADLMALVDTMGLEERVRRLGHEFELFLNLASPDGEAFHIEPLRPTADLLFSIPGYLAEKTRRHFGRATLAECLGRAEKDLVIDLANDHYPKAYYPDILAFMVTPQLDVYPNLGELMPWWRLGNLAVDGIDEIMRRFEHDDVPGLYASFHIPVSELARRYGRPDGKHLYTRGDLVGRWLRMWGEEQGHAALEHRERLCT